MNANVKRHIRFWAITGIVILSIAGIYRWVVGSPTTPMTVQEANEIYGAGLKQGMSQSEVEAWLISNGIQGGHTGNFGLGPTRYEIFTGQCGDEIGNDTIEKLAGINGDLVEKFIRVEYPDADHDLITRDIITVYLFFDKDNRLIKHWVKLFNLAP